MRRFLSQTFQRVIKKRILITVGKTPDHAGPKPLIRQSIKVLKDYYAPLQILNKTQYTSTSCKDKYKKMFKTS